MFFNVLTTKLCASFLIFLVSSMVIMSRLLSLLNKPWTQKPSSTLFVGKRFPFSSKLISPNCLAVCHFSNISDFTINCRRFVATDLRPTYMNGTIAFHKVLPQVWFNNGAYKTKEGCFSLSKQINNSITDFRLAFTCRLFVFWETFPKFHYLFYIWPDFYNPICNTLFFHTLSGTKV